MLLGHREGHHLQSISNHSTELGRRGEGTGEWTARVLTSAHILEFVFLCVINPFSSGLCFYEAKRIQSYDSLGLLQFYCL